jgi:hypothetical protein
LTEVYIVIDINKNLAMKKTILAIVLSALISSSYAQQQDSARRRAQDSLRSLTEQDHKALMSLLGITSLRPGRNGTDPKHPNYANYDESKANPYPILPDALTLKNGKKVTTAKEWWEKRRPEIIEDFDREVYGRTPKILPKVKWELIETKPDTVAGIFCTTKTLLGHVDNSIYPAIKVDIQLQYTSRNDVHTKAPVILNFGSVRMPGAATVGGFASGANQRPQGPTAQEQIIQRGWVYATIAPNSIQADNGAGLTQGIIGLMNKGQRRKADDWGSLKAWGWGAGKALDYFETDPKTDAKRVAIQGHSRYGKAALVALAYEPRLATGFISSSGEGGASLYRRDAGEIIENVAGASEYHWMAGNFIKYAGPLKWDDLPVDSHELIALVAPRPVFISSGEKGDEWVDARGMFMAAVEAGPVYKLLGKKDLGTTEFPRVETGIMEGDISFRQHSAGHTPTPNWPTFLDFAAKYFDKAQNPSKGKTATIR